MFTFASSLSRRLAATALVLASITAGVAGANIASAAEPAAPTGTIAPGSTSTDREAAIPYFITSTANGLSIVKSGGSLLSRTIGPGQNPWVTGQLFYFHYNAPLDAYVVESVNGGCVDIFDGLSTTKGAKLAVRSCDGTTSQLWESHINGAGWYLKNEWSGLYATQESFSENTAMIQWPNIGILRQRFDMPAYFG